MLRTANGTTIPTATLRFTTTGADKVDVYLRYCFTGVRITEFTKSTGGDRPSEKSVQLRHDRESYTQGSETGCGGNVFTGGWDLLRTAHSIPVASPDHLAGASPSAGWSSRGGAGGAAP